jgi:predicted tellurium resistance membrane protein TerC
MFEWVLSPEAWLALAALTALEVVLGIDNIIFITIVVGRLPPERRDRARIQGLALAMLTRVALLLTLAWMMQLTTPLVTVVGHEIAGRDLILIGGGLFLLWKSSQEIWDSLEGFPDERHFKVSTSYALVLAQIAVIDIVFSLDSVITAVGMARHVPVMVIAIMLAVGVVMLAAKAISEFVEAHPSIKMLALSFLILVGVALIGEGFDMRIPKGYIYFAMAFSVMVEMLNIRMRGRRAEPVQLRGPKPAEWEETS